jgi:hypothetical protein
LYEGTRVTQNVKNRRGFWSTARNLAVISLLSLGAASVATGCGSDGESKPNDTCTGDDCAPSGRYTPCQAHSECDEAHGFSCVEGECSYECETHADCVEVGHCDTRTVDDEPRNFCVRDDVLPTAGELYTRCPNGDECAQGAVCIGAGAGDLDAYCSIDCTEDDECAAGYACGTITRNPCHDACNVKGAPTDARCVPDEQIGPGKLYRCGDLGVERSVCREREFCSPCESDADCLALPNQICAPDGSGEKICTRRCDPSARSGACPWGNAGICQTFDRALGPTCGHRFGSCHGTGGTCEPCRSNADCPNGACASSGFTGERWCVNFKTTCECKNGVNASGVCTDGGCPPSPSGLPIQCIGTEDSSLFNICYAANSGTTTPLGSSPQTGCWGN